MKAGFEHVLRVDHYYDGLREGIALFGGQPHHFRAVDWVDGEGDPGEDRFELRPIGDATAEVIVARAEFRNSSTAPDPQCPPLTPQEVRWSPVARSHQPAS
jgi:hypothetical protein